MKGIVKHCTGVLISP